MNTEHISDEILAAMLDNALIPNEQQLVSAHLPSCSACSAKLASLRSIKEGLSELHDVQLPRSFTLPVSIHPRRYDQFISAAMLILSSIVLVMGIFASTVQQNASVAQSATLANSSAHASHTASGVNIAHPGEMPTTTTANDLATPGSTYTTQATPSPVVIHPHDTYLPSFFVTLPFWLLFIGSIGIIISGFRMARRRRQYHITR